MPLIERYDANTKGRDFIMGDLHAFYSLFMRALDQVKFDPAVDRFFSTGDLGDRGPEPVPSIRLAKEQWFKPVKANHDDALIDICIDGKFDRAKCHYYIRNNYGCEWMLDTDPEILLELAEILRERPLAIEIDTPRGSVGIVHADIPLGMDWPTFIARIEARDQATRRTALMGRDRILSHNHSGVAGIGRVFVGHTIQDGGSKRYGNVYAIDTGAFVRGVYSDPLNWLTVANIITSTASLGAPDQLPQSVDVRNDNPPPTNPFGVYASPLGPS